MRDIGHIVIQGFTFLLVFGSIIFLAVVTTKYVGGKAGKSIRGKYIQIIETISLGMDKHIYLIKAGEQFLLVASSGKNLTYLTTLKDNGIELELPAENPSSFDFKNLLDRYTNVFKSNDMKHTDDLEDLNGDEAVKGDVFKNNLDKLRSFATRMDFQVERDGDDYTNDKK